MATGTGPLLEQDLTSRIIGGFYDVYNYFGGELPEQVYTRALEVELAARGLLVAREAAIEVRYKGERVGELRADLIVESKVILEVKAGRRVVMEDERQLLNYMRAAGIQVGLLLHFGPRPGFRRLVSSRVRLHPGRG
jgi:GxxExxY protein